MHTSLAIYKATLAFMKKKLHKTKWNLVHLGVESFHIFARSMLRMDESLQQKVTKIVK